MAVIERQIVITGKDSSGNTTIDMPVTSVKYVEGAVETVNGLEPDENGDVTLTDIKGNAETATALQTKRNINGVAFNGTSDITIDVGVKKINGVAADSTGNVVIADYVSDIVINGSTITITFKNGATKTLTTRDTSRWALTKGVNGYARDASTGFTIQWGYVSTTDTSSGSVSFPKAFTNIYNVTIQEESSEARGHSINGMSNTGFNYYLGAKDTFRWLAVGGCES